MFFDLILVPGLPHKDTFEVRVLPTPLDDMDVLMSVELYEVLLTSIVHHTLPTELTPYHLEGYAIPLKALLDSLHTGRYFESGCLSILA